MKKLINEPGAVVPDMLRGLCMADGRLALVPTIDVVLRADYETVRDRGQVALISGGGAGHEPAHAGYVGEGMLTAAVTGAVFTSPSVDAVLGAIRLVTGDGGCLLIVKNYTGDRLNFGLAAAIARSEGLQVDMMLVDDDVALDTSNSRTGGRGLAGTVLVHKLAGAFAAEGATLDELADTLAAFASDIGTMSAALSSCTNPSVGKPGFELGASEIEYGLGIHGERGIAREQIASADAIADRLVDRIVSAKGLKPGDRVALLVNGLGGTPPSELAIMAGSAIAAARRHGLSVERSVSGSLLTALEMAGCSISLAKLDDRRVALLDAPSSAPAWTAFTTPVPHLVEVAEPSSAPGEEDDNQTALDPGQQDLLRRTIAAVADTLLNAEAELTELDSIVGDGDLGISLSRGAKAVKERLSAMDCAHLWPTMREISTVIRRSVGGTSGPLYSAFVLAAGQALRGSGTGAPLQAWGKAMQAGTSAISDLGGAWRGDSTMLDALIPAADSLRAAGDADRSPADALAAAVDAARDGARSTAQLNPRVGRASYVGERAVGHVDPGAQAATIWLDAIRRQFG